MRMVYSFLLSSGVPERPPPDRQETGKPGMRDGSLIGPCAIFLTVFGQEFLIPAVRFGRGTNVAQNIPARRTLYLWVPECSSYSSMRSANSTLNVGHDERPW